MSATLRRQLIYRSKQRGWLEVDLILGSWATDHVMKLSEPQLKQYELILNKETLDIYTSIIGNEPVDNEILQMIRTYSKEKMVGDNYVQHIKSKMSN